MSTLPQFLSGYASPQDASQRCSMMLSLIKAQVTDERRGGIYCGEKINTVTSGGTQSQLTTIVQTSLYSWQTCADKRHMLYKQAAFALEPLPLHRSPACNRIRQITHHSANLCCTYVVMCAYHNEMNMSRSHELEDRASTGLKLHASCCHGCQHARQVNQSQALGLRQGPRQT